MSDTNRLKVHVLRVDDSSTSDNEAAVGVVHVSVHSSHAQAVKYLAAYCRWQWEQQGEDSILSDKDDEAIAAYFDYWEGELSWTVDEREVDPAPTTWAVEARPVD